MFNGNDQRSSGSIIKKTGHFSIEYILGRSFYLSSFFGFQNFSALNIFKMATAEAAQSADLDERHLNKKRVEEE